MGPDALSGASFIVAPSGVELAGPLHGREGIITAEIDMASIHLSKFSFDAASHSARPDIFCLEVDFRTRQTIEAAGAGERVVVLRAKY